MCIMDALTRLFSCLLSAYCTCNLRHFVSTLKALVNVYAISRVDLHCLFNCVLTCLLVQLACVCAGKYGDVLVPFIVICINYSVVHLLILLNIKISASTSLLLCDCFLLDFSNFLSARASDV